MQPSGIKYLDLSVERVPSIETRPVVATPTPLAIKCAESLKIIKNRGFRDAFGHASATAPLDMSDLEPLQVKGRSRGRMHAPYRILVFDYGHIRASHTVDAKTDDDAIKTAQLQIVSDNEVWNAIDSLRR